MVKSCLFFSYGKCSSWHSSLKGPKRVLHLWINELSGEDNEETNLWNRGSLYYHDCTQGQVCPTTMTKSPFYSSERDEQYGSLLTKGMVPYTCYSKVFNCLCKYCLGTPAECRNLGEELSSVKLQVFTEEAKLCCKEP